MPSSRRVEPGEDIRARDYGKLRDDVIDDRIGHGHAGGDDGRPLPIGALDRIIDRVRGEIVFGARFDGGGAPISEGATIDIPYMPALRVTGWYIRADVPGSARIGVSACRWDSGAYASIVGITPPVLDGPSMSGSRHVDDWTTEHPEGTAFRFTGMAGITVSGLSVVLLALRQ